MTTYARITATNDFDVLVDLTEDEYAALVVNGKAAFLRLYFVDPQPVPSATQVLETGPVQITSTEARQTWRLRGKSPAELEADSINAERAKIDEVLADIVTQRAVIRATWDAYTANQLRAEQWRDRQVLLRLANLVARRIKQEIA